jgi:hypothetical protein
MPSNVLHVEMAQCTPFAMKDTDKRNTVAKGYQSPKEKSRWRVSRAYSEFGDERSREAIASEARHRLGLCVFKPK